MIALNVFVSLSTSCVIRWSLYSRYTQTHAIFIQYNLHSDRRPGTVKFPEISPDSLWHSYSKNAVTYVIFNRIINRQALMLVNTGTDPNVKYTVFPDTTFPEHFPGQFPNIFQQLSNFLTFSGFRDKQSQYI